MDLSRRAWTWIPVLVGVAGTAATLLLWHDQRERAWSLAVARFERDAHVVALEVESGLGAAIEALHGHGQLRRANDRLEPAQLEQLGSDCLGRVGLLSSLGWVPRVSAAERARHEQSCQREGRDAYEIRELDSGDRLVAAGERDAYYPLELVVPYDENARAWGYDLGSRPALRDELERAGETGELACAPPLGRAHGAAPLRSTLVLLPVYVSGATLDSPRARREALRGFVLGAVAWERVLGGGTSDEAPSLFTSIADVSQPGSETLLGTNARTELDPAAQPLLERTISRGGRDWLVRTAPTRAYLAQHLGSSARTAILVAGLAITALLTTLLLRGRRVQAMVERRTDELREANERLRTEIAQRNSILASMGEGVVVTDSAGRFLLFNPLAEEIVGIGITDAPPDAWPDRYGLYLPDARTPFPPEQLPLARALRGHKSVDVEIFIRNEARPEGTWIEVTGTPVRSPEDATHASGAVAVLRDVSQRRAAERALQESEARQRAILEAAADAIVTLDATGTVQSANPATERLFGYPVSHVVGSSIERLIPAGTGGDAWTFLRRSPPTGDSCALGATVEVVGRRRDGEEFSIELSASEVPLPGRRLFTVVLRDVTHQKLAAAALREAKDAAERASRAKTVFLANVSHELRTPLNAILGYCELLLEEADNNSPTTLVPDLKKIAEQARHQLTLIDDLLDVARVEAGKVRLASQPFEVCALVRQVADTVRPLAAEQRNELDVRCDERVGRMNADVMRVRQCLLNLLGNACKFTEGGKIAVEARRAGDRGEWIELEVSDTGIGIDPERLVDLFAAFEQADPSTTRRHGGTGLGLAISLQLARLMGGDLTARSEPGRGSTFTLRLPSEPRVPERERL